MDMNAARIRFSLVDDEPQLVQQTWGAEIKLFSGGREVTYQHGRLGRRAQADEGQVRVRRIGLRGGVPGPDLAVARPGIANDRLLAPEQVAPTLSVSVLELLLGGHPAQGPGNELPHDPVARWVDPDHRVGPVPDDVSDCPVVPVDDPRLGSGEI